MTLIDKAEALACCKVFDHWGPEGRQAAQLCRDAIDALPARGVGVRDDDLIRRVDALEKHIEDTARDTHKLLVAAEKS